MYLKDVLLKNYSIVIHLYTVYGPILQTCMCVFVSALVGCPLYFV